MPELIDKQKVQTEIALIAKYLAKSDAQKAIISRILFMIDKMQAIEPEVRHGEWETWGCVFHGIKWKRCSRCGKCADVSYYGLLEGEIRMSAPAICGCCGAKMDGGADNG